MNTGMIEMKVAEDMMLTTHHFILVMMPHGTRKN